MRIHSKELFRDRPEGESMSVNSTQDVLTTGQVARICNVAPRTVSKWFDTGKLRGYRIPGSRDRRIPLNQLIRFMRVHGLPLEGLDGGVHRVLIAQLDAELTAWLEQALVQQGQYEVRTARCAFSTGFQASLFKPHTILIDPYGLEVDPAQLSHFLKCSEDLPDTKLVALCPKLTQSQVFELERSDFAVCVNEPLDVAALTLAMAGASTVG